MLRSNTASSKWLYFSSTTSKTTSSSDHLKNGVFTSLIVVSCYAQHVACGKVTILHIFIKFVSMLDSVPSAVVIVGNGKAKSSSVKAASRLPFFDNCCLKGVGECTITFHDLPQQAGPYFANFRRMVKAVLPHNKKVQQALQWVHCTPSRQI